MDPDRWRQISRLYHEALERPAGERRAFVDVACSGDEALRGELDSLLANEANAENFFAAPAAQEVVDRFIQNSQTLDRGLEPGVKLGSYQIVRPLGHGGMGFVFLAHDTTLHRRVALKVLDSPADDESARTRLLREARSAAALNHPNICTVYEVGQADGRAFIAMEYVEGRTLSDLLAESALRVEQAARYGIEAADALAHAHDHGVVHRDLKAANAIVTKTGRLKLVDFGLARRDDALLVDATTMASIAPQGVAVGTPYAMAPEQIRGGATDARTDVWALGVLVYEMVSGARPFSAPTVPELFSAILRDAPAPLPDATPAVLRLVIEQCLEKEPDRRYQSAHEIRKALEAIHTGTELPRVAPRAAEDIKPAIVPDEAAARTRWLRWMGLSLLALALAAGFLAWQTRRPPPTGEPLRADSLTTFPGIERYPSFSPDGNHVAFMWTGPRQDNADIYVQMLGAGSAVGEPLRLTSDPGTEQNPVWSPDGRWIAFLQGESAQSLVLAAGQAELRLIPPLGGPQRKVADLQVRWINPISPSLIAWCPASDCLVVTEFEGEGKPVALFLRSLDTGERRQLTYPDASVFGDSNPVFSPDGRSLVFQRNASGPGAELHWLPLQRDLTGDGPSRLLVPATLNAIGPAWTPDSREILFSAKGGLWRLAVAGDSAPARLPFVGEDGMMPAVSLPTPGRLPRLVYVRSFTDRNIWQLRTTAPGSPSTTPPVMAISSTRDDEGAQLSPDGLRVAFASDRSGENEIWLSNLDGSSAVQLTSLDAEGTASPRWSPDGESIVFNANPDGQQDIYVVAAGGGRPRRLTSHQANDILPSFSRDGNWIYFASARTGSFQIWKAPVSGGDPVLVSSNAGVAALEAPDGASVYYTQTPVEASALWRLPTSGGEPVKVLDGVVMRAFVVLERGIYYIDRPAASRLRFFDFATKRSSTIADGIGDVRLGLTASADGRTILYTRLDSTVDDLMMVENFR
jgi:Tol biopolymer transport system component/predicted Ser/Thr protein kinase